MMERRYFEKKIINLIPSNSLKGEIKRLRSSFTDLELLAIIFRFEEDFNKRIYLFKQAKLVFKDKKILRFIDKLINDEINEYNLLINKNEDEVYEVFIKSDVNSYEERYLCPTYEACFNTIFSFFKAYKDFCKINKNSEFKIQKRRVRDRIKTKDIDDDIVTATYNYKMKLLRIYSNNKPVRISGYSLEEIAIDYPHLFNGKELVSFYENNRLRYGINCFNDLNGDSCVNYLDCDIIKDILDCPRDYLINHIHLDFGYLNIVDLDNVGREIKEDYNFAYNLLNKAHAFREDKEDE